MGEVHDSSFYIFWQLSKLISIEHHLSSASHLNNKSRGCEHSYLIGITKMVVAAIEFWQA